MIHRPDLARPLPEHVAAVAARTQWQQLVADQWQCAMVFEPGDEVSFDGRGWYPSWAPPRGWRGTVTRPVGHHRGDDGEPCPRDWYLVTGADGRILCLPGCRLEVI